MHEHTRKISIHKGHQPLIPKHCINARRNERNVWGESLNGKTRRIVVKGVLDIKSGLT